MVLVGRCLLFALVSITVAAPAEPIGVNTIITDLQGIDTTVNALHASTTDWDGGIPGLVPITAGIAAVHVANRKAYADALLAPQFDSADSNTIVNFLFATVVVDIPSAVQETIARKPQFAADGQTAVVESSLKLLKNDHDTLSAILLEKTSANAVARAGTAVKIIDDAIQSGIDAFAS
jgi:hypothetical protein